MAHRRACTAFLLPLTLIAYNLQAQNPVENYNTANVSNTAPGTSNEALEAQIRINDAAAAIKKMKDDPRVNELLEKAKGLMIVPHFLKAAFIFGGRGGAGLLLTRQGDHWNGPAFYKTSGGSVGVQIGGAKGTLAMLLMSDKAVLAFQSKASSWSLNAGAGLTAANYTSEAPESGTLSDVIVWSDVKGMFGGAAVGATNITRDQKTNEVYYNSQEVTTRQILSGAISSSGSNSLRRLLPTTPAAQVSAPAQLSVPAQAALPAQPLSH